MKYIKTYERIIRDDYVVLLTDYFKGKNKNIFIKGDVYIVINVDYDGGFSEYSHKISYINDYDINTWVKLDQIREAEPWEVENQKMKLAANKYNI